MDLPIEFTERMKKLLETEYDEFLNSYHEEKAYGLRINPLKYNGCVSAKALPFTLAPVAWAKEGFYAISEERPGKHPLHEGGAYYIQEPSAMSVVSLLDPKPGDIVCDLCAAPGGKSTQIAGRLSGKGLLISNEIFPARAKILSQNIERLGIGNAIVSNESPDNMAAHFPFFFDKIVVDAPCSGEGMFRKDETAVREWTPEQVTLCAERQKHILECADTMLSPGGIMVYSTCTFAPEEDEEMILWFLKTHPDYELEDWRNFLPEDSGLEGGRENFVSKSTELTDFECSIHNFLRLWPHKLKGEGHFAARLKKHGTPVPKIVQKSSNKKKNNDINDYLEFYKTYIKQQDSNQQTDVSYQARNLLKEYNNYQYFKDELYLIPNQIHSLNKLKVIRAGIHLGTRKKNRFEPAHALAKILAPSDVNQAENCNYENALAFLHGETIPCDIKYKGWTLVCYEGISLGWGKAQNGILKNHYPKGLRINY